MTYQYKDFNSENIAQLTPTIEGAQYIAVDTDDVPENSLYNNPETQTVKRDLLKFSIEGLSCECYLAEFYPVGSKWLVESVKASGQETMRIHVQVFRVQLPYEVSSVYIESKTNLTLNSLVGIDVATGIDETARVRLEGDFNRYFTVIAAKREEVEAFTILAPNIMVKLLERAGNYDIEFVGNAV